MARKTYHAEKLPHGWPVVSNPGPWVPTLCARRTRKGNVSGLPTCKDCIAIQNASRR